MIISQKYLKGWNCNINSFLPFFILELDYNLISFQPWFWRDSEMYCFTCMNLFSFLSFCLSLSLCYQENKNKIWTDFNRIRQEKFEPPLKDIFRIKYLKNLLANFMHQNALNERKSFDGVNILPGRNVTFVYLTEFIAF